MIQFRDLKPNYPVYVLNKQDMSISQGMATSVGFPRMELDARTGSNRMVVDITISLGDKSGTYAIPENSAVTYASNDLILATEKQGLAGELEAIINTADQIIDSVARQKENKEKATALLGQINPVYKDKQETELRFKNIEDSVARIEKLVSGLADQFKS